MKKLKIIILKVLFKKELHQIMNLKEHWSSELNNPWTDEKMKITYAGYRLGLCRALSILGLW